MSGSIARRDWMAAVAMALSPSCARPPGQPAGWQWQRLPDLPMTLAGQFAGVHNGALIVAGGSWFPVSKWTGGVKKWVGDVFVLERPDGAWQRFALPRPLAYGGSASTARGLLLVGGGDEKENVAACHWLRWDGRSLAVEPAAPLPAALANCGAALLGGRVYVSGGQQSPTATVAERVLLSLDLTQPGAGWRREAPLPGAGRILASIAASGAHLSVAGGAELFAGARGKAERRYLQDAWRFTPGSGWSALPDLPEPTCAAPAAFAGDALLVLGGSDGVLAPREAELADGHPGFSRGVKSFLPAIGQWRVSAQLPFSLVTTTATVWRDLLVVPGGEDRPAHRSAAVYALPLRQVKV